MHFHLFILLLFWSFSTHIFGCFSSASDRSERNPTTAKLRRADENGVLQSFEHCPHKIEATANVNAETLYIFGGTNGSSVWLFKQGKLIGGPYLTSFIFPDGPDNVHAAFTTGNLTILIQSRTVFGFEFDAQSSKFRRSRGFPRELHSRILFSPEAAFPLANGSIIIIKDKVFATYDADDNTPHMLGNVDEFFPNLPQGLRSGFPASPDFSLYHMLTADYAFLFDIRSTRSVGSQTIGQFLGCDPTPDSIPRASKPSIGLLQPIPRSRERFTIATAKEESEIVHGRGPPGAQKT